MGKRAWSEGWPDAACCDGPVPRPHAGSPPPAGPSVWKGGTSMSLPNRSQSGPMGSCLVLSCSWLALASWGSVAPVLSSHLPLTVILPLTAVCVQLLCSSSDCKEHRFYSTLWERQQLRVSEGLREVLSRTESLPM